MRPLLCELHAHTTWSDGELSLRELVDLYGGHGFDVLCVTDHASPAGAPLADQCLRPGGIDAYLDAIARESLRARERYGLLLLPGLELTFNDEDADRAAHALAVGLESAVPLEDGIAQAMTAARAGGAAVVAAHPSGPGDVDQRSTRRFWTDFETLAPLVDRWELVNRHDVFAWVAERRLPAVANGDFHRPEHLSTWKTLLPCRKDRRAVVRHLRSAGPALLAPFAPAQERIAA
jgi:processive 1,2-diacylglycerol beta-glucosyltransferase